MRNLFALFLALTPAVTHAADFKCVGAEDEFSIGGTIRTGANGRIDMEERDGFPGIYLVGAALNEGVTSGNAVEFTSEPDHTANDTIATLDMPSGFESQRQVLAKLVLRYVSPETKKPRALQYKLRCDRQ